MVVDNVIIIFMLRVNTHLILYFYIYFNDILNFQQKLLLFNKTYCYASIREVSTVLINDLKVYSNSVGSILYESTLHFYYSNENNSLADKTIYIYSNIVINF